MLYVLCRARLYSGSIFRASSFSLYGRSFPVVVFEIQGFGGTVVCAAVLELQAGKQAALSLPDGVGAASVGGRGPRYFFLFESSSEICVLRNLTAGVGEETEREGQGGVLFLSGVLVVAPRWPGVVCMRKYWEWKDRQVNRRGRPAGRAAGHLLCDFDACFLFFVFCLRIFIHPLVPGLVRSFVRSFEGQSAAV